MNTIPEMFERSVMRFPGNTLMWQHDGTVYQPFSYEQVRRRVHEFAAGLLSMGINKGDRVALLAEARLDWLVSELGVLYAGAVSVPLSVRLVEKSELKFRLEHSGCRMAIVSAAQYAKVREVSQELDALQIVVVLDPVEKSSEKEILFSEIIEIGRSVLQAEGGAARLAMSWQSILGKDLVNICYTSGTTAQPKGIMLTHRNYITNVEQATTIMPVPEYYLSLIILPWDHSFAHTVGLYALMNNGAAIAAVQPGKTPMDTLKNIPKNIREIKPTFMLSVPALAKNFKKGIEKNISDKGPLIGKLFNFALSNAYAMNGDGWKKDFKPHRKLLNMVFDRILFSKIRAAFGGRLEFFIGGGALLDLELQKFFYAVGMPMYQGYGLTEAAPIISSNAPMKHKLGTSGFLVSNLELKICDEDGRSLPAGVKGEIVVMGENVMAGYWRNDEATRETLKDGWLHTGDMGYMDEDGFLYVLGRFKSLLIANDGEKYSPEGIEEAMVQHSQIMDQCILYNNQSPYTIALVVPAADALRKTLKAEGVDTGSEQAAEKALLMIKKEIDAYLTGGRYGDLFPDRWIPTVFAVLESSFTPENQMINSSGKVVRGKVLEHFDARLQLLFTPEGKNLLSAENLQSIKTILKH